MPAIVGQTLHGNVDTDLIDGFEGRILALSSAHGLPGRQNWDRLDLDEIIDLTQSPFGVNDGRSRRFSIHGSDIPMQSKAAVILTMVFHELVTNAAKYGALSDPTTGQINIAWHIEPTSHGDKMRLCWQERGGPPVIRSSRKGFDSRFIQRRLERELDAEVHLDYDPAGLVCHIVMPLPLGEGLRSAWRALCPGGASP